MFFLMCQIMSVTINQIIIIWMCQNMSINQKSCCYNKKGQTNVNKKDVSILILN